MTDFKYIYLVKRNNEEGTLIKLKRNKETIAGITPAGDLLILEGAMEMMNDNELLELFMIPPKKESEG